MEIFRNVAIVIFSAVLTAQAQPICAVIPFTAGAGFTQAQADVLCDRFRTLVEESKDYDVMSKKEMSRTINSYLPQKPASLTPYFVIVGRVLHADYIITGSVEADSNALWLNTALCDIKNEKIIKRVKIFYRGDVASFMKIAAKSNLNRMFPKEATKDSEPAFATQPQHSTTAVKPRLTANTKPKTETQEPASARTAPIDYRESLYRLGDYAHDNLQLGFRMTYYQLIESEKPSFLGSINQLKEDQDYAPHLFARIRLPLEPFWISIGYNKLRAITWTKAEPEYGEEGYTDGTIQLSGPFVLLHFHSERDPDLRWFGEVGFAMYSATFVHDSAWQDAGGVPGSHIMDFYDTYGLIMNGGCEFFINDQISLTTYLSYTRVSVDMTYYLYGDIRDERVFPMSNIAMGIGMQYSF